MSSFIVGDVLAGKYEIKAVLGAGGMGTVYRARQIDLGRDVAIKVPNPQALEIPGFLARFSREARLVAKLVHDNIVQVYEYVETEREIYIVMEYVEGQDLKTLILKPPGDLELTVRDIAVILRASCEGLAHAHENGIVHRDIKPHNIMVQPRARGKWRVKIMDFGIAHLDTNTNLTMQQQEQLTMTGQAIGTPSYMSPEQIRGTGVTAQSDIYSFGCVAFFTFTRQTPFQGTGFTVAASHLSEMPPSIRTKVPMLPTELDRVINCCLEKDPAKRPQEASELGQEFYDALKDSFDVPMTRIWPRQGGSPGGTDILEPTSPGEQKAPARESKQAIQPTRFGVPGATASDMPTIAEKTMQDPESMSMPVAQPLRTDVTAGKTGATRTTPSQLSEATIPYAAAAPVSAAPAPKPAGMTKLILLVAAGVLVLAAIGAIAGIALKGGKKNEVVIADPTPTATPTPQGNNNGTEPKRTPDSAIVVPIDTPAIDTRPTPQPMIATPTVKPTPSPVPTPTPDPILRRLETLQQNFANATTLLDRSAVWRRAATDPEFATDPRMQSLVDEFALKIATNPTMHHIDGGTFTMGSATPEDPSEGPPNNVRFSSYDIGVYEVTALEFATFLNQIPPAEAQRLYAPGPDTNIVYDAEGKQWEPAPNREIHPANKISWEAADRYVAWLNDQTSGPAFRLPTEAEWEFAARGGTTNFTFPWGNPEPDAARARFDAAGDGTAAVVEMSNGRNGYGLCHMAGNVAEWCHDWYIDRAYDEGDRVDPRGPASPPDERRPKRSLRGGGFQTPYAKDLRVTRRDRLEPDKEQADVGFRLARDVK